MKKRETVTIVEDSTRELAWFTSKHTLTLSLLAEHRRR